MSEKSTGVKGKPPDKKDDLSEEDSGQYKEKVAAVLQNESENSAEKVTPRGGTERIKIVEKHSDSKVVIKPNANKTTNNVNPARTLKKDDDRDRRHGSSASSRVSSRGREVKGSSSLTFQKSDYRRTAGMYDD